MAPSDLRGIILSTSEGMLVGLVATPTRDDEELGQGIDT
jgi:hypothetical protein